jgi:hypothetical protein
MLNDKETAKLAELKTSLKLNCVERKNLIKNITGSQRIVDKIDKANTKITAQIEKLEEKAKS